MIKILFDFIREKHEDLIKQRKKMCHIQFKYEIFNKSVFSIFTFFINFTDLFGRIFAHCVNYPIRVMGLGLG